MNFDHTYCAKYNGVNMEKCSGVTFAWAVNVVNDAYHAILVLDFLDHFDLAALLLVSSAQSCQ